MKILALVLLIVALMALLPGSPSCASDPSSSVCIEHLRAKKPWVTTWFSDKGSTFTGIPMNKYPIKWKGKKLWPAAVHEKDHRYLYKVIKVKLPGVKRSSYLHISDICNKCDKECKTTVQIGNKKLKKQKYRLLDIHEKAFNNDGFRTRPDNFYDPSVKVVGVVRPGDIKGLKKDWYLNKCNNGSRKVNCKQNPYDFSKYCEYSYQ